ncbi:cAMP phosphodiesterase [Heterostelium album PN500]|uniref:cAMP phosphodiesterase n=1 Tax=Heterostelium pallidum (strain ATCC 26659 / Pp 5 / PN500) TaxID=670386 RepID=D3BQP8_HETP5|nr:cAMP phosphodiesterase [Heterostelium album PN500]EFA76468.1 cAMP phosphodiesterase [Heterostelium album PN500]|eukprot:XP_020428600.1 cAMP phosphodiesterase [Heterostelium album PN500]
MKGKHFIFSFVRIIIIIPHNIIILHHYYRLSDNIKSRKFSLSTSNHCIAHSLILKCEIPSRASTSSTSNPYPKNNPSTYPSLNSPPSKYNTYPYPASPYSPNYKSTYPPYPIKDLTTSSTTSKSSTTSFNPTTSTSSTISTTSTSTSSTTSFSRSTSDASTNTNPESSSSFDHNSNKNTPSDSHDSINSLSSENSDNSQSPAHYIPQPSSQTQTQTQTPVQYTPQPSQIQTQNTPQPSQIQTQNNPQPTQNQQRTPQPSVTPSQYTPQPSQTQTQNTPQPTENQRTPQPSQIQTQNTPQPSQKQYQTTSQPSQTQIQNTPRPQTPSQNPSQSSQSSNHKEIQESDILHSSDIQYPSQPQKIVKHQNTYNPNSTPIPAPQTKSNNPSTPTPIDKVKNNAPPSNIPTAYPSPPSTPYPAPPFQNTNYKYNPNTEFSSFDKQQSLDNPYNMYSNDLGKYHQRLLRFKSKHNNFLKMIKQQPQTNWMQTEACKKASFITIPLGTAGGLDESNLSSFLLTKKGSNVFIALDAGTLWTGIARFISNRNYNNLINITFPVWATQIDQQVAWFIRNHILGYFIGHSHLDHINGLIEASPEDYLPPSALDMQPPIEGGLLGMVKAILDPTISIGGSPNVLKKKAIVGLPFTVNAIKTHLFNNIIWPNLPGYGRYDYYTLDIAQNYDLSQLVFLNETQKQALNGFFPTTMEMMPFETCHNDILSTSFLFTDKTTGEQIIFFSDTGVPSGNYNCDWQQRIYNVWRKVKIDKLKAIYLECSFPNNATDASLFGHLRPKDIQPMLHSLIDMSVQTIPKTNNLNHDNFQFK